MNRGLPKHFGCARSRARKSASCFHSGGESQSLSAQIWANMLPRQRSITTPSCQRSLPIELFHAQFDNQTPSESLPSAGTSQA